MCLFAAERRIENTNEPHRSMGTQNVPVMFIERIQRSGPNGMHLPVSKRLDFPTPFNTVHGLQVMLVFDGRRRAGVNQRVMQRETKAILTKQKPPATPIFTIDDSLGSQDVRK